MRKRVKRVRQHSKTLADPCLIVDSRKKKEPATNRRGGFIGFFFRESDSRVKSKSASEKWTNIRAAEWPICSLRENLCNHLHCSLNGTDAQTDGTFLLSMKKVGLNNIWLSNRNVWKKSIEIWLLRVKSYM